MECSPEAGRRWCICFEEVSSNCSTSSTLPYGTPPARYPLPRQDVLEELDPSIEPVLSKAIVKQGNREVVRLGDKELDWSHDFRLYVTTKLGNPHYTPEVRQISW